MHIRVDLKAGTSEHHARWVAQQIVDTFKGYSRMVRDEVVVVSLQDVPAPISHVGTIRFVNRRVPAPGFSENVLITKRILQSRQVEKCGDKWVKGPWVDVPLWEGEE